jgi:hypothetical protein
VKEDAAVGRIYIANIKSDMPTADQALRRVTAAIDTAKLLGNSTVKIIHGYGSTGIGGRIRTETRRFLGELQKKGKIKMYISGEDFSIFNGDTQTAFLRCPALRQDCDLDRQNNGITIVLL